MNLFHKRPLSLILCVMLGGFTVFAIGTTALKIAIAVIGALSLLLTFIIKAEKQKCIFVRVLSAALCLCALLSYLYFNSFFIYDRYDGEVTVTAEVTDKNFQSFNKLADVKTKEINGEAVRGRKLRVYFDDDTLYDLNVGDTITFTATLSSFHDYDSSFDAHSYYASRGYSALIEDAHGVVVVETGDPGFSYKLKEYRKAVTGRIIEHSDEGSGGLLAALLLGDRASLSPMLSLDFSRIGTTHILALSGMHLVILGFAVERLLSLLKANKKWQKAGSAIFALAYMAFTGFPVSVVRAGIMSIIATLLFLLSSQRDSVTNLFISVTLICLIQPYSALDLSLWLSALATLGVILVSELNDKKRLETGKVRKGFFSYIKTSLLVSFFAISATFAITVCSFKEISPISPIATLIFSVLTELYMYFGLIFILLCGFIPIGKILVFFGDIIASLAGWLSSFKFLFASADFPYIRAASILFTLLFFVFAVVDIKRKKTAVTVLCSLLVMITCAATISTSISKNQLIFKYIREDDDEILVISENGECAIVDITTVNSSDAYSAYLRVRGYNITSIEKYIYTRYSSSICSSANTLMKNILIDKLYLPAPTNEQEVLLMQDLDDLCSQYRTELIIYEPSDIIFNGDFAIFPQLYIGGDNKKNALAILYEDEFYTYLSSGTLTGETGNAVLPLIDGCQTLILGSKGRDYDGYRFLYELPELETFIISSDGVTFPQSVLDYYKNCKIRYMPTEVNLIR